MLVLVMCLVLFSIFFLHFKKIYVLCVLPARTAVIIIITTMTRKPSLEVALTTLATYSADRDNGSARKFSAGCHLFTISNSDSLFSHGWPSHILL